MKVFFKDLLREIKKSLGRFISILSIVALGTAFFVGIKASVPMMKYSADSYFDRQNMTDIKIISTVGFTESDLEAIKKVYNVEGVQANYTMDFLTKLDSNQLVVKVFSLSSLDPLDPNFINQPKLVSGRMPINEDECVIEEGKLLENGFKIGDEITLYSGDDTDILTKLKYDKYKIVGTVYSPEYLSYEKGSSSIGSGVVNTFIYINKSNYLSKYYTEILVTIKDVKELNSYEEPYFEVVNKVANDLENLGIERIEIRFDEIKELALDTWQDSYDKYEASKKEFEDKINEKERELENAKTELILAQVKLEDAKNNFEIYKISLETQISAANTMLNIYNEQYQELLKLEEEITLRNEELINDYQTKIETNDALIKKIDEQLADDKLSKEERRRLELEKNNLLEQNKVLTDQINRLNQTSDNLAQRIDFFNEQINKTQDSISDKKNELEVKQKQLENEIKAGQAKIDAGNEQYLDGKILLEQNKQLGIEEFRLAEEKLLSEKIKIENMDPPSWYVLDRNMQYAYKDYESVADRMDGIAKVFPVFFILVAALVCLTTMTRMVDEQRGLIGTYKALGFSSFVISLKYVLYALLASIVGSIVGSIIGMNLFPRVIFYAWNIMYNIDKFVFVNQFEIAFVSSLAIILVTVIATVFACYKELVEVPSQLMRPKAPKVGKKIFLEYLPFIWNKLSFSKKVTMRNIFRYKKRFFMTVIGISGCMALLLSGFGIKDSISHITHIQFEELTMYDALISLNGTISFSEKNELVNELEDDSLVKSYLSISVVNVSVDSKKSQESVQIIIPKDSNILYDYIDLRKREDQQRLYFARDGAIITEKLAHNQNVDVGDKILITLGDGSKAEVKVSGICENYIGHYIYMTPSYYYSLTNERSEDNSILVKFQEKGKDIETVFGNKYLENEQIANITFYQSLADSLDNTINSISFVTYVLIVCAGLLAFVVLYNLTNVNISERIREIATIKVLGFYDKEVYKYVFRENIYLTLIGVLVGCYVGKILHSLIMDLAEMSNVMFGRNISLLSYVLSGVITLAFGYFVNFVMRAKLRKIKMVESLKSVE